MHCCSPKGEKKRGSAAQSARLIFGTNNAIMFNNMLAMFFYESFGLDRYPLPSCW